MNDRSGLLIARAYHRAWSARDHRSAEPLLSDDLRVEVPLNSYAGKADFFEAVCRTAEMTTAVELLAALGSDEEALLLYDMTLPIGTLRVAEHFSVSDGRIQRIRQVHDTAALRAAGFERAR